MYQLDKTSLERLYIAYVRPLLEYGSQVWTNISDREKSSLEEVQTRAARIVLGVKKGTSPTMMIKELGWTSLEQRRTMQRLTLFFNILKGRVPELLTSLKPSQIRTRTSYSTRKITDLDLPRSKTESHAKSYFPQVVKDWNKLPETVKSLNSK